MSFNLLCNKFLFARGHKKNKYFKARNKVMNNKKIGFVVVVVIVTVYVMLQSNQVREMLSLPAKPTD